MFFSDQITGKQKRWTKLPKIVIIVAIFTLLACISNSALSVFKLTALGWFVPLLFSLLLLFRHPKSIKFPFIIWAPWFALVASYLYSAEAPNAFQRSIMMLCPVIVGMAVSTVPAGDKELQAFGSIYKYMAIFLGAVVLLKTGILLTGELPEVTGLAAEVMTASLLCCIFAATYASGKPYDLAWWAALAAIPVIAVTRMGILASGLSLPLTFAPLKLAQRVAFILIIGIAGLVLFNSDRIQEKMFYGGSGTLQDIRWDNPKFAEHGRRYMWDMLEYEIGKEPYFGHGANASEPFISKLMGGLTHPHNDWLRLSYDYGYIGAGIFAVTLLLQMLHALKSGINSSGDTRVLFFAGASSMMIFALFMLTDNIILYAAFFGNLQFTILGIAYAAHHRSVEAKKVSKKRWKISWQ